MNYCHRSIQHDDLLASLPTEILVLVHSRALQADTSTRSCLALEATCKHLRGLLYNNARFEQVSVEGGNLATTQQPDSFWRWIAANGKRTDSLVLHNLELHQSTPALCDHAGVLQAKTVDVSATVIDTLEPLRGLLNLAAVENSGPVDDATDDGAVGLEPLAELPALEHVDLDYVVADTTSLAPLRSMATLTSLNLDNNHVLQLDDLGCLSKLKQLSLAGFHRVTSVAPLGCLTALTRLVLLHFASLDNVVPLHALTALQDLALSIASGASIGLEPLSRLTSLTRLVLGGDDDGNRATEYDLQPLSEVPRKLQVLVLRRCLLRNMPSLGSLGATLSQLTIVDCKHPPGFQLAPLLAKLPGLILLDISGVAAADLGAIGQLLERLRVLRLKRASVASLVALIPLTRLTAVVLESCSHVSSIEPLMALTRLQHLDLLSCPQLTSLHPLIGSRSLQQLRLEGCPQLEASVPTSLHRLLAITTSMLDE
jgi:Leucine-rich repeat (LRR) protein